MKKLLCVFMLAAVTLLMAGCNNPDTLRLDLARGYGEHLKLIHLNASTTEKRERMETFKAVIENADPLEKDFSLFAYYPDYRLEITSEEDGETLCAIIDVNGEYVDFYYPGPNPEASTTIYRSHTSAADFKKLVHHA